MPSIIDKDSSAAKTCLQTKRCRSIILHFSLILIVAVSVRIYWGLSFPVYKDSSDAIAYHDLARGLLETGKFGYPQPHSFWPPLWPFVLYLKFLIVGDHYISNMLFIVFINMFTLALLFQLSMLLFPDDLKCAILSGYIYALYPNYIGMSNVLVTENLFNLLFIAFILLMLTGIKRENLLYFVLAGIFLGFCNLCRGPTLALPFFLLLIRFIKRKLMPVRTSFLLILLISSLLITSVWTVRNYIVFKMFIPINTNSGRVFYYGNNPSPIIDWLPIDHQIFDDIRHLDTEQAYKAEVAKALNFMVHRPFLTVLRWFYKMANMLMPEVYFAIYAPNAVVKMGMYAPVFIGYTYLSWYFVLIGFITWLIMRIKTANLSVEASSATADIFFKVLLFIILYWFLFHCFFLGLTRFRYPLESILFILAIKGYRWLLVRPSYVSEAGKDSNNL